MRRGRAGGAAGSWVDGLDFLASGEPDQLDARAGLAGDLAGRLAERCDAGAVGPDPRDPVASGGPGPAQALVAVGVDGQ